MGLRRQCIDGIVFLVLNAVLVFNHSNTMSHPLIEDRIQQELEIMNLNLLVDSVLEEGVEAEVLSLTAEIAQKIGEVEVGITSGQILKETFCSDHVRAEMDVLLADLHRRREVFNTIMKRISARFPV